MAISLHSVSEKLILDLLVVCVWHSHLTVRPLIIIIFLPFLCVKGVCDEGGRGGGDDGTPKVTMFLTKNSGMPGVLLLVQQALHTAVSGNIRVIS